MCPGVRRDRVVVADLNPHRLELALRLGASRTINVARTAAGDSGFAPNVLLECSGHTSATTEALRALARAGRAVLIGMGGDDLPSMTKFLDVPSCRHEP